MFVVLFFSVLNLVSAFLDQLFSENLLGKYQEKKSKKPQTVLIATFIT